MATNATFIVGITLSSTTVDALLKGGYSLSLLFATAMTNAAARPTVAFSTRDIMPRMALEWSLSVGAYTSSSPILAGRVISPGFETVVEPGETFLVHAGGGGEVKSEGVFSAITMINETGHQFTSGLSRVVLGSRVPAPIYAVPLYGHQINVATPLPRCLLLFTTQPASPGTALEKYTPSAGHGGSCSQALLVSVDQSQQRSLSFDMNTGWEWRGNSWGTIVRADADLVSLLIKQEHTS
jgi:hypothetical protein